MTGPESDSAFESLVALLGAVQEGSIGLPAARTQAARIGRTGRLESSAVAAIVKVVRDRFENADRQLARTIGEVVLEAAQAAWQARPEDTSSGQAFLVAGTALLLQYHKVLLERGDIRVYQSALTVHRSLTEDRAAGDFPSLRGLAHLRLGTLVLDCYTADRSPGRGWQAKFDAWVDRAAQANDPELLMLMARKYEKTGFREPAAQWPEPLAAMEIAERSLRSALGLVVPERRGSTLKALMQTLLWREQFGGATDHAELERIGRQALDELPADDIDRRVSVVAMLQQIGVDDVAGADDWFAALEGELAPLVETEGEAHVWDSLGQAAVVLQHTDPERGLRLLMRRRELASLWAESERRHVQAEVELQLFARAYRLPWANDVWAGDLEAHAARARDAARDARTPETARAAAATVVAIMLASTSRDREAIGLALAPVLGDLDITLWAGQADFVYALRTGLLRGEGVNRRNAGDAEAACRYYREAADGFRVLRFEFPLAQQISYLVDVLRDGAVESLDELTAWLAAYSLEIEQIAPAGAPPAIVDLVNGLLSAYVRQGTGPLVVQMLLQVVMGRRFTAALTQGTRDFELDAGTRHLLDREAEFEAQLPAGTPLLRHVDTGAGLRPDDLLTALVDEYEEGPSDTPADRVANVRRAAERRLTALLTPEPTQALGVIGDIGTHLDDRTALLMLFEGAHDGLVATWQMLVTRGTSTMTAAMDRMPAGLIRTSSEGRTVSMPGSGYRVGGLRREVQRDPGPFDVSPEGQELLTNAAVSYTSLLDKAAEQGVLDGIEYLVVAPHGATHFLPLHLVGPPGKPLADRFAVCYVTSLAQLTMPRPATERTGAAVFALSYADQPGLPTLDDSVAEAETIAAICGTVARTGAAATEDAVRTALQRCRYVHIRAHGQMIVEAPSFHTVFLHPAEGSDGRLRAYELLALDLTGLELVTLGACETALGRVDRMDNPRGLPAALLLAGTRAVIGTLWEVYAETSTYFFSALYRELIDGAATVVDAFTRAQRATRDSFPQYRDWGAFYLVGVPTQEQPT